MSISHKLIQLQVGDSIELMRKLCDKSVDMVITSPPYNINTQYDIYDDNLDFTKYYAWSRLWLKEVYRVLKDGGRFCLQIPSFVEKSPLSFILTNIALEIGFTFRDLVVWNKNQIKNRCSWGSYCSPSNPRIIPPFELILNFHVNNPTLKKSDIKSDLKEREFIDWTNAIWSIAPSKNINHPATFPRELAKRCIKLHSYPGSIILDPFIGIGTSGVVAIRLRRKIIGFDISQNYINIARDTIIAESKKATIETREIF